MITEIILACLCVVLSIVKAYFANKGEHVVELITKTCCSIIFVCISIIALIDFPTHSDYASFIILAGVFGLVGDVFLSLKHFKVPQDQTSSINTKTEKLPGYFGILVFFIGHLLFAVNLCLYTDFNLYLLPAILVLPICFCLVLSTKKLSTSKSESLFLVFYYGAINTSIVGSINIIMHGYTQLGVVTLVACALFFISDSLLGFRDHSHLKLNKNVVNYLVMITYYAAQCIYAISICVA